MAAAVVNATVADQLPAVHTGLTPIWKRVQIATTSTDDIGDVVLLVEFPANAFIRNVAGAVNFTAGAHDSGSPVWAASLGFGDVDGVLDFTLATAIDEGDEGESSIAAAGDAWLDIGGKFLLLRTTTASSAGRAAADFEVGLEYTFSIRELYDDGA